MQRLNNFGRLLTVTFASSVALLTSAFAQPALPSLEDETALTKGKGLASLSDDALLRELGARGLESLLNRAFDLNKVADNKRAGILTILALRDLSNPDRALSARMRQERVGKIVQGIEEALPTITDPKLLEEYAAKLIVFGVERDVNTLEYWGENPKTQATLKPVVETVIKILITAQDMALKKAEEIGNSITSPNDPKVAVYEQMDALAGSSEFTRHMVGYYLVLAMDKADPERLKVIDESINYLKQFDNADSQVQPVVRARLGKLNLAKDEYNVAKEMLDSLGSGSADIQPAPQPPQQFEAKYFSILCDLAQSKWQEVDKGINELIAWYKTNLAQDKPVQDGANAAVSMLKYRVNVAQSKLMGEETVRTKAKGMAVQELLLLLKERPELQTVIYEQLMAQLPDKPDLKALDALLLQAMVRKADQERTKSGDEPADVKLIERGIAAAQELTSRLGKEGVAPEEAENALLLIGLFYEKLDKKLEAGNAFLDFVQKFPSSQKNAGIALDYAMAMIAQLRQASATADAGYVKLYERFLPIAIAPPFNRAKFAFEYAQLLQKSEKYAEAAKYYGMVGNDDPRLLATRYFQMLANKQVIDNGGKTLAENDRNKALSELQRLADEVTRLARQEMESADTDQKKNNARGTMVKTALLAAEVARTEQKDPDRVLKMLEGFETQVTGLAGENDLLAEALSLRVAAFTAAGKNQEAAQALLALLQKTGGREGANMVYHLLEKLESDLDRARSSGNTKQVKEIAQSRSLLSSELVTWAKSNQDGSIRQYYYRYAVFDAASKKLAADLADTAAERRAGWQEALTRYQALLDPEMVKMYKNTLQGSKVNANDPDPQVILGIGLLQYSLGNYKDAQGNLSRLLNNRKLGMPTMVMERDGVDVVVDNDQYWEATLKRTKSNLEVAKADKDADLRERTITSLKLAFIEWGSRTGGKKFSPEFQALVKEVAPDFTYDDKGTQTEAQATTVPVTAQ